MVSSKSPAHLKSDTVAMESAFRYVLRRTDSALNGALMQSLTPHVSPSGMLLSEPPLSSPYALTLYSSSACAVRAAADTIIIAVRRIHKNLFIIYLP